MKKPIVVAFILVAVFVLGAKAQGLWTGAAVNHPMASTISASGCNAPLSGVTNICDSGTGEQISCNGAAYIPGSTCTPVAAGVTGITVCNASGGGCVPATLVNGVVTLDIPKAAQTLQ